ncbi:MAG: transglutaminase family protein [Rhodobacteraceae bacterium]|nr:transglutaminase family protein [Paracoccaceae bacterium]
MRLSVHHRTTYRFENPRRNLLQSHRLYPSKFDGQSVVHWDVTVKDCHKGASFVDGAGNSTWLVRVPGPVEELVIDVTGVVDTTDLAGVLRGHREKTPPMAYLRDSRLTRADVALEELAREVAADAEAGDPLGLAHALSAKVSEAIKYTPGATEAATTAAEALGRGMGVCQDHAHALIAAAHVLDLPARYVAGYMFADPDDEDADRPSEASHAWAELFVDGLGWVGFDPANECCPDARYIRICSGADAFDAAPIRGVIEGQGEEDLNVDVAIEAVQQ